MNRLIALVVVLPLVGCGCNNASGGGGSGHRLGTGSGIPSASSAVPLPRTLPPVTSESCPDGMIFIPEGTFTMGLPPRDELSFLDERHAHTVKLSAYCIDW